MNASNNSYLTHPHRSEYAQSFRPPTDEEKKAIGTLIEIWEPILTQKLDGATLVVLNDGELEVTSITDYSKSTSLPLGIVVGTKMLYAISPLSIRKDRDKITIEHTVIPETTDPSDETVRELKNYGERLFAEIANRLSIESETPSASSEIK